MPHQITCGASALPGKTGKRKSCISLKCCRPISALPEFNQLLDFFNLLTHDSYSCCGMTP